MDTAELTFEQYRSEVLKADHERLVMAGHAALCEMKPRLAQIAPDDFNGFTAWCADVNKLAGEIFRRLN